MTKDDGGSMSRRGFEAKKSPAPSSYSILYYSVQYFENMRLKIISLFIQSQAFVIYDICSKSMRQ